MSKKIIIKNDISFNKEISIYSKITKLDIVETIYSIFYISTKNGETINYARLHSELLQNNNNNDDNNNIFLIHKRKQLIHKFISIGHSIDAKNGEFYPHIINFKSIIFCKKNFNSIWEILDNYIRKIINKNKINIYYETQFTTNKFKKIEKNIKDSIFNKGIQMDIIMINFYICIYNILYGGNMQYINKKYFSFFYNYLQSDMSNIAYEFKKFNKKELYKMYQYCTKFVLSENEFTHIGEKLLPLYLNEVKMPFNLFFKPWKELIITSNVSDLVANNISINFPLYSCWFYIRNINKLIFNGEFLRIRIRKSIDILNIIDFLKKAKDQLRIMINSDLNNTNIDEILKQILLVKNNIMSDKIKDSLEYIKNNLLLSEVVLSILIENCGKTIKNDIKYNKNNSCILNCSYIIFSKYMFEIIYSIMCLNKKLHVNHGDLHINNIIINEKNFHKKNNVDYIIDKNNIFSFPFKGGTINIIDFDQSAIEFGYQTQLTNKIKLDNINYHNEINNDDYYIIINKYLSVFPSKQDYIKKIKKYAILNNKEFLNYMTLLDIINSTSQIKKFIKDKKKLDLLIEIIKYCKNILSNNFIKSLENEEFNKYDSGRNFLLELIKKLFSNYKVKITNKKNIICNFQNKIKYSTSNFIFMKKEWINSNSQNYYLEMKNKYKIINPIIPNRHTDKYI